MVSETKTMQYAYNNDNVTNYEAYEMGKEVVRFCDLQKDYYMERVGDEEIAVHTTQEQYNGMLAGKRRLQKFGLKKEVRIKHPFSQFAPVFINKDGKTITGTSRFKVKTTRSYYMGEKQIYSQKDKEISIINFLKYDVINGCVSCPNCGNVASIDSYTDGCDYCGSQFSVKDFEPKVSSFTLTEDSKNKTDKPLLVISLVVTLLTALDIGGWLLFAFISAFFDMGSEWWAVFDHISLELLAWAPAFFCCTMSCVVALIVSSVLMSFVHSGNIKGKELVQKCIKDISIQELVQSIESKIRYIYMAEGMEYISAFVKTYIDEFIRERNNVVDVCVSKIFFTQCIERENDYRIEAEVIVRLHTYANEKIKMEYERLHLALEGRKGVVDEYSYSPIVSHKCEGCGANVNLSSGGICNICGREYEYEKYDWIITILTKGEKVRNAYGHIPVVVIGLFFFAMLLMIGYLL